MVPIQVEVGRAGVEEGLVAKGKRGRPPGDVGQACALGVWGTSSSQKSFHIKRSHKAFTRHAVLYALAHTIPFAETLSALLTSLENATSPCKTDPGVSFSELSRGESLSLGCLVHIRVLADLDCSSACSAISLTSQEAN